MLPPFFTFFWVKQSLTKASLLCVSHTETPADHAAFEAEDSDAMEERLIHFGIGYTKAIVPGTDAAQLFFYDPEG